ncbi:MAG: low molecular weight phosphotyrosine protein phosphatase [Kiritimatiellae bacterium]|nr:low molecular weight phosphotyrosine protein phosphatase [Kiritimatiellia bacterium]
MAEYCFRDLALKAGRASSFLVASAATSSEELGNPVYPPVRRLLASFGISTDGKTARRILPADYARWDRIIGMDDENRHSLLRLFPGDPERKISLLLDWTPHPRPVADPWYTRDFQAAWHDILSGCTALLSALP